MHAPIGEGLMSIKFGRGSWEPAKEGGGYSIPTGVLKRVGKERRGGEAGIVMSGKRHPASPQGGG